MEMSEERAAELLARTGDLGPYTGEDAVCPKCLYAGADTEWRKPTHIPGTEPPHPVPECLARECRCCGFTWYETVFSPLTRALTAEEATESGAVRF